MTAGIFGTVVRLALSAAVLVATATAAAAQPARPARPFRGLFGSGITGPDRAQSLTLTLSGFGGYDDNVLGRRVQPGAASRAQGGSLAGAQAGVSYALTRGSFSMGIGTGASLRYYPRQDNVTSSGYSASMTADYSGARNSLALSADVAYAPRLQFQFLDAGDVARVDPVVASATPVSGVDELQIDTAQVLRAGGSLTVRRRITNRLSVSLSGRHREVFGRGDGAQDQATSTAALRLRYQLTQGVGVYALVGNRWMTYSGPDGDETLTSPQAGAGLDLAKALSLTRSTTLSFGAGTSVLTRPQASAGDGGAGRRSVRLDANVGLMHLFGRSWTGALTYSRGVRVVEDVDEPILSDAVAATLVGALSRRLTVNGAAGYSWGRRAFSRNQRQIDTASATATVQFALSSWLSAYGQLLAYRYITDSTTGSQAAAAADRLGARVGVSLLVPLVR